MKKARFLFFVGIIFLFAATPQANALVTQWDYSLSAMFVDETWSDNSTTSTDTTSLSWGTPADFGGSQSSLVINPSAQTGTVGTYIGGGLPPSTYWGQSISLTHNNKPITGTSLTGAVLQVTVLLDPLVPDNPALPSQAFTFNIKFAETPNSGPNQNDVFALPNGFPNFNFYYDDNFVDSNPASQYFVNVFPTGANVLGQLNAAYASLAGVSTGTMGFTTVEGQATTMNFSFSISSQALSTVPEPSTLILLGFGMVGLAGIARRKLSK